VQKVVPGGNARGHEPMLAFVNRGAREG
jgi:hypothetical protein